MIASAAYLVSHYNFLIKVFSRFSVYFTIFSLGSFDAYFTVCAVILILCSSNLIRYDNEVHELEVLFPYIFANVRQFTNC